jgi:tRNA pseudouridine55 synthase
LATLRAAAPKQRLRNGTHSARVAIRSGKGFYVRSLARDLGTALGTGGHCATLRRIAVGPFTAANARRFDDLPERIDESHLLPLETALAMTGDLGFRAKGA